MESLGKAAVYFVNGGHAEYDAVELLDSGVLKALDKVQTGPCFCSRRPADRHRVQGGVLLTGPVDVGTAGVDDQD